MKVLIVLALLMSINVHGKMVSSVKKSVRSMPSSVIKKTAGEIDKSSINNISKRVRVSKMNDIDKLDSVIDVISKKGKDAELLLKKGPITTISLYSKHGDDFIHVYKKTQRSILSMPIGTREELIKIIPVETKLNKFFRNFKNITESDIAQRFITVMKRTGDRGYQISKKITKYAMEHPKSSAIGAMYMWFLADPTGFSEALKKSENDISTFASEITKTITAVAIETPLKVADAAGSSIVQSVKNSTSLNGVFVLVFLFFTWIVWKFRVTISSNLLYKKFKNRIVEFFTNKSKSDGPL